MKFLYLFSILLLVSCTSVPKDFLANNAMCHYDNPIFKVSKDELNFKYLKLDSILSKKGVFYIENDSLIIEIQKTLVGKTDKKTKLTKWINYYPNNKIESVSFFLRNSTHTEIGKETHYNNQGNIEKVIDHEKGYTICWAEAVEIAKKIAKKDIKKYQIDTFYLLRTNLNEFPESTPKWTISMEGNDVYNEKDDKSYVIDGVTGKLIRTYTTKVIYDSLDE